MTLTDEEAREILTALQRSADMLEAGGARWTPKVVRKCITLLESRIGQPDLSARVRELEGALRPFVLGLEDRRERWVAGEAAWDPIDEMRLVDARGVLAARALKGGA